MNVRRIALIALAVAAAVFLLLQFLPVGGTGDNPPPVAEPDWDSDQTRALAERACFDCHSNQTGWPWYAAAAPVSWLVRGDVAEGRAHLNFSDWNQSHADHEHGSHTPQELVEAVRDGAMPPAAYLLLHPAARLSAAEREALIAGLMATAERSPVVADEHAADDHDDGEEEHGHDDEAPEHDE